MEQQEEHLQIAGISLTKKEDGMEQKLGARTQQQERSIILKEAEKMHTKKEQRIPNKENGQKRSKSKMLK